MASLVQKPVDGQLELIEEVYLDTVVDEISTQICRICLISEKGTRTLLDAEGVVDMIQGLSGVEVSPFHCTLNPMLTAIPCRYSTKWRKSATNAISSYKPLGVSGARFSSPTPSSGPTAIAFAT